MKQKLLNKLWLRVGIIVAIMTTALSGTAWAETSTLTFTAKCNGSGTANDGVTWTVTSDGTESNYDGAKGIHYGTGSAQVGYIQLSTSDISGVITKVVVNASTASGVSATASVTVGGSAFGGDAQSLSETATNYTFNGSATGEIVVRVEKPSKATKAIYVKQIVVTYEDAPSFTLTAVSNNESYGTVSVVGSIITATPEDGYRVSTSEPYSVTAGTATVEQTGNTFSVTADADCTVQINFEAIPKYAVTIDEPTGGTLTVKNGEDELSSGDEVYTGTELTIEVSPAARYNFTSWEAISGGSTNTYTESFSYTVESSVTIRANFTAKVYHNAIFSVNGNTYATVETEVGEAIAFPSTTPGNIDDKVFRGWVATPIDGTTNVEPTFVTSATMGENDVTYYAVFADVIPGTSELVNDVLTRATTGVANGATTYSSWNNKTSNSSAVYAGNSAGGNDAIQLRSNNNNSGIVSTTSGGKVKRVTVEWHSNTASERELGVYVSNSPFETPANLYPSLSANVKMLGRITNGTDTEFEITGDYTYIGLRSESGAMYLSSVTITWETGTPDTYSDYCTTVVVSNVAKPEISVAENFYFSTTATITCETEGATIYYNYDSEDSESWTEYTGDLTLTETKTIYAKAVKDEDESRVASATATKTLAPTTVTVSGDLTLDLNGETSVDAGTLTASVTYNEAAVDGATVAWSSSDEAIATIDETGAVTLLTTGEVTFTATYAGNDDYAEATGTKTITIIDSTVPGTEGNPYTVADVIAGKASGKTDVYVIGYIVGEFNSKTQAPRTSGFTTDANIALADEFTTSPTAALSIPVALPTDALKTAWGCKTSDGSTIGTKVIVCGNGESYFTVNGIKSTSSVTAVAQSVTVSSAGYATYCSENALDFTGTGITAYVGTRSGDKLRFTPITQVPANTGLLLVCAGGTTADVPVIASAPAVADNCLTGVTEATTLTADDYILNVVGGQAGFFKAGNDHKNLKANRAYIPASVGGSVKSFALDLEDNADGIEETLSDSLLKSENIYNLAGQRLSKMQKGINIVNGKKVLK